MGIKNDCLKLAAGHPDEITGEGEGGVWYSCGED